MTVLDRPDLEASPLADLHAIASQLGLDGFRRLRKAELIEMILDRQGGAQPAAEEGEEKGEEKPAPRRRRRSPRGRGAKEETSAADDEREEEPAKDEREEEPAAEREAAPSGGRRRRGAREEAPAAEREAESADGRSRRGAREESSAEGVVELQGNGSAFLRLSPPEPSDGDIYVSAAQVRRCELVDGDRVSGPVRMPRRSERYPSLVRVETINGDAADGVSGRPRYDDLPAAFPTERFELGSDDETLKAIEWLTPIGRGSRVLLAGGASAGKSETLRQLVRALAGVKDLDVSVVLAGVRPEEVGDWRKGEPQPVAALTLASPPDAQSQAIERAVESAKRHVSRGEHAVLAIDTLDGLPPHVARKALAAARNVPDGGSLTVIATASAPLGGESTVIALDPLRTLTGKLPPIDLLGSFTLRPELLVGERSAAEIAQARAKLLD